MDLGPRNVELLAHEISTTPGKQSLPPIDGGMSATEAKAQEGWIILEKYEGCFSL